MFVENLSENLTPNRDGTQSPANELVNIKASAGGNFYSSLLSKPINIEERLRHDSQSSIDYEKLD